MMIPLFLELAVRETVQGNGDLARIVLRNLTRTRHRAAADLRVHADAAVAWLCRAHDRGHGGVARSYCLAWHPFFRTRGWLPAYPETTGYIIPTMFDYAAATQRVDLRARAIAMAEWEMAVQLPTGAVMGGVIGMPPTPAVFNTGQVIFGWLRAAAETGRSDFVDAATRAGEFLVDHQDTDGVWRRGASQYANRGPQIYNTRVAWALLELAAVTGDRRYRDTAVRSLDAALAHQLDNGWFAGNCLEDDEAPLTHTIAYAARGMLESAQLLNDQRYLQAAERTARALLGVQRRDGSLAGRYDRHWRPRARWSCLTGNVQVANIWLRLAAISGVASWVAPAQRSIRFVASTQDLTTAAEGIHGGIAGSYPVYGDYGRFEYLNWAAKFFVEAVLLERACRIRSAANAA